MEVFELNRCEFEDVADTATYFELYFDEIAEFSNNSIVIVRNFDLEDISVFKETLLRKNLGFKFYDLRRCVSDSFALSLYRTIVLLEKETKFRIHSYRGEGSYSQKNIVIPEEIERKLKHYQASSIATSRSDLANFLFASSDLQGRESALIDALRENYEKHSTLLFDLLISASSFSKNELMLSLRSGDLYRCELNEFRTLIVPLARYADEIDRSSRELASYTRMLKNALESYANFRIPEARALSRKDRDLVKPCLWLSSYFASVSLALLSSKFPQNAFLYTFRSLETFLDAVLLECGDMEVSDFSGDLQFSIDQKKVLGFGKKWYKFAYRMKRDFGVDVRSLKSLEDYIAFRNDLSQIHGNARVNVAMANEFSFLVESFVERIEKLIWRKDLTRTGLLKVFLPIYKFDIATFFISDTWRVAGLKEVSDF